MKVVHDLCSFNAKSLPDFIATKAPVTIDHADVITIDGCGNGERAICRARVSLGKIILQDLLHVRGVVVSIMANRRQLEYWRAKQGATTGRCADVCDNPALGVIVSFHNDNSITVRFTKINGLWHSGNG